MKNSSPGISRWPRTASGVGFQRSARFGGWPPLTVPFLVPPDDAGADIGVLFWHKDGYSTACGHGTIALGAWAAESGLIEVPEDGDARLRIDVPSGRVAARIHLRDGFVDSISFENVAAYVIARDVNVAGLRVDTVYGGAIYATLPAAAVGLRVAAQDLPGLIAAGREIKRGLANSAAACHPYDDRLSGIYGTIFYEDVGPLHQRNVTVFADGEVDRSPCGSGTSARCALMYSDGTLALNEIIRQDGIAGGSFTALVLGETAEGVLTEVAGTAYRTGEHRFTLDPRDPIGTGFILR